MKPTQPLQDGPITKALLEAVQMRRQMLDAGHPPEEVDYHVGIGLKAILGNKRSEPWKFYCEHCRDTGWVNVHPSAAELVRLTTMYGDPNQHAGYVVKCQPCKWTEMEREKRRKASGQDFDPDDDLAGVGITKKPSRGFKRFSQ